MSKPVVAIIGRPNVGKSTFFNYIVGSRISIVEDTPGVTRDRIYGESNWRGRNFTLIDTGGIEPEKNDVILTQMRLQANIAIDIDAEKVVPKIKKDPIFIPVIAKISIPFNIKPLEEKESKLNEKEITAKEHLEDMFEITRNLSYDDIRKLKNDIPRNSKTQIEQQNENQREIE